MNSNKKGVTSRLVTPLLFVAHKDEVRSYLQEMSGEGTLYSYVTFQKAFHPSVQDKVPYTVGVVEMEGGVRIISNIVDCEPEQLACNKKVKMKWMDCEEYTKPVFELVEEA